MLGNRNNLEFKVKKEGSYSYRATKGVTASTTLNPIGTKLARAPASSQSATTTLQARAGPVGSELRGLQAPDGL